MPVTRKGTLWWLEKQQQQQQDRWNQEGKIVSLAGPQSLWLPKVSIMIAKLFISYSPLDLHPYSVCLAKITKHIDEIEGIVTCKEHDLFENGPKYLGELWLGTTRQCVFVCVCTRVFTHVRAYYLHTFNGVSPDSTEKKRKGIFKIRHMLSRENNSPGTRKVNSECKNTGEREIQTAFKCQEGLRTEMRSSGVLHASQTRWRGEDTN